MPHCRKDRMFFLIDIQEKMREGKGHGHVTWVKNFNLKQRAGVILFMQEETRQEEEQRRQYNQEKSH